MAYSMRYYDPEVKRIFDEAEKREQAQLKKILKFYQDQIDVQNYDAAATIIHGLIASAARKLKIEKITKRSEKLLIQEVTKMIYQYLIKNDSPL
jgi:hypothetical protein